MYRKDIEHAPTLRTAIDRLAVGQGMDRATLAPPVHITYPTAMVDNLEDDYDDAAEAVLRVTEALRLAGVDTDAIADALLSKAILFKLAEGDTVEDVINDVEEMITALVKHVGGEG
jgi:hypothetical protein